MEAGKTGVIGILDTGIEGPTIAYRVDIDALPILESSAEHHVPQKLGFRSQNEGFMHACGHDSHATIGTRISRATNENQRSALWEDYYHIPTS